ncbi:MAG TPA: glycoside hydrolase family 3 N-terminal domain-containing protein [Thermoplasmataceae archaeon]|nr:glycoside hydrolase family 3 N-terminal domain-containing protein [Thermoplasmataceae archaeon]
MRPGRFIQTGLRGCDDREEAFSKLKKLLPFSIVLFRSDYSDAGDLSGLIHDLNHLYRIDGGTQEPIIAVDQEGGNVVRLPWLPYNPSNYFLGVLGNSRLANYVGLMTGNDLYKAGIRWNLAPVLDTLNGDNQVILERSFSDNVSVVADLGSAYINGLQSAGVAATAKHFPGHGAVFEDSHLVLPKDHRSKGAVLNDAYPFKVAVRKGVKSVMLSHVLFEGIDPDMPASLSVNLQNILRDAFGFKGVILTDSITMKALSNNFDIKEIVFNSLGNEVDVIETSDLESALEIASFVDRVDGGRLIAKNERIESILPDRRLKFEPPGEILSAFSISSAKRLRDGSIDPYKPFGLVYLDTIPESKVSEKNSEWDKVLARLRELGLNFVDLDHKQLEKATKLDQLMVIGRNEHLKERWSTISEFCESRKCVFISTSVNRDLGTIDDEIGYIAAFSSKSDNLLGAIYKALELF